MNKKVMDVAIDQKMEDILNSCLRNDTIAPQLVRKSLKQLYSLLDKKENKRELNEGYND